MSVSKADWTKAKDRVPWVDDGLWDSRMSDNPDALYRIVADAYDYSLREEEATKGQKRPGRRPKPDVVPLEVVLAKAFPYRVSEVPLGRALAELMGDEPQRPFAKRVPCHQTTLSRMLRGDLEADLEMLGRLAAAGNVPPWYFVEWRAKFVAGVVERALIGAPHMGLSAVRILRAIAERG